MIRAGLMTRDEAIRKEKKSRQFLDNVFKELLNRVELKKIKIPKID